VNALTVHQHDLTLRPITGPDELDLFNSLPYVLNDEVGGDLAAGRRRPEWLWLALRGDRVVARAGWWSRVCNPGELVELMTLVLDGTLDAHSRDDLTRMTPSQAARQQYHNELERYASPREWWRIAALPDGEPAGFVIPAHNGYNPIIAYLGVAPAHRGRGYVHDLLAAGTSLLAAQNVPRIRAATDVGNAPMAAAFALAGYVTFGRQIDMTWR
jgi:RimJ/RimL family protein N-acetyltransferase